MKKRQTARPFWIKEMADITLPPDSQDVQTLLWDWDKADAECLKALIFEKQHGSPAAEADIVEHREAKTVEHIDDNGTALEVQHIDRICQERRAFHIIDLGSGKLKHVDQDGAPIDVRPRPLH